MKRRTRASRATSVEKEVSEDAAVNQSSLEVKVGDLIWLLPNDSAWWPAQVVDEDTVSGRVKPSNKSTGDVLVRLYGSYEYLYVDPTKFCMKFENVLQENNGCYTQILKKTLEQDLARIKSDGIKRMNRNPKVKISAKSASANFSPETDVKNVKSAHTKLRKPGNVAESPKEAKVQEKLKSHDPESGTSSVQKFEKLSARRVKVMRTLGLVAPSGSPFCCNGQIFC